MFSINSICFTCHVSSVRKPLSAFISWMKSDREAEIFGAFGGVEPQGSLFFIVFNIFDLTAFTTFPGISGLQRLLMNLRPLGPQSSFLLCPVLVTSMRYLWTCCFLVKFCRTLKCCCWLIWTWMCFAHGGDEKMLSGFCPNTSCNSRSTLTLLCTETKYSIHDKILKPSAWYACYSGILLTNRFKSLC